jgi:hypothetical protein
MKLVKMTKEGFAFHHNPDRMFDAHNVQGVVKYKHYRESFCETLAIMGTGKVLLSKTEDKETIHKVRWKFKHAGMFFYYTMWYGERDIRPLTLVERILLYFKK